MAKLFLLTLSLLAYSLGTHDLGTPPNARSIDNSQCLDRKNAALKDLEAAVNGRSAPKDILPEITQDIEANYERLFKDYFSPKFQEEKAEEERKDSILKSLTQKPEEAVVALSKLITKALATKSDKKTVERMASFLFAARELSQKMLAKSLADETLLKIHLESSADIKKRLNRLTTDEKKFAFTGYKPTAATDKNRLKAFTEELQITPKQIEYDPDNFVFHLQSLKREFTTVERHLANHGNEASAYSTIFDKIGGKGHQELFSCHDGEVHRLHEKTQNEVLTKPSEEFDRFLILHQKDGSRELEELIERSDFDRLPRLGRRYFYNPFGLKAELLYSLNLLKTDEPLLAASYIQGGIKKLEKLIPRSTGQLKTKYEELKIQFELMGAVAFPMVGDRESLESAVNSIKKQAVFSFEDGRSLNTSNTLQASRCLQTDPVLFERYFKQIGGDRNRQLLDALSNNGSYLHTRLAKLKPDWQFEVVKKMVSKNVSALKILDGIDEKKITNCLHDELGKVFLYFGKNDEQLKKALIPHFVDILTNPSPSEADASGMNLALKTFLRLGKEAVPYLITVLKDPNFHNQTKMKVAKILSELKTDAVGAVPALFEIFSRIDDRDEAQLIFLEALTATGDSSFNPLLLPKLEMWLGKSHYLHSEREKVAKMIAKLGEPGIRSLKKSLQETDLGKKEAIMRIIGPELEELIPDIITIVIERKDSWEKSLAILVLGRFGKKAHSAVPLLLKASLDSDAQIRTNAIGSLSKISSDPQILLPVLKQGLNDGSLAVKASSVYAIMHLARIGEMDLSSFIPRLKELAHSNPTVENTDLAAEALEIIRLKRP